jgi:hypothetical protein
VKDWGVARVVGRSAAGRGVVGLAGGPDTLAWACAICTETREVLAVGTKEEVVVLVELCSVTVSISATGAAASPVVGLEAAALTELVVVATGATLVVVTLLGLADAAATFGTAVHRRPSMVVRKAPDGRPLDAIFRSQSYSSTRFCEASRFKRKEQSTTKMVCKRSE